MNFTKKQYEEIVLVLENKGTFYRAYGANGLNDRNNTYGKRRSIINTFLAPMFGHRPVVISWPHWVQNNDIEDRDQIRRYFDDRWGIDQVEANKYADIPSVWDEPEAAPKKTDLTDPHAHLRAAMRAGAIIEFCTTAGVWRTLVNQSSTRPFTYPPERYRVKPIIHVPDCPIPIPSPEYLAEWQASQSQPQPESIMSKPITITTKTFANGTDISTMADAEVFNLIAEQEAEIEGLKKIKAQPKKLIDEIAKREAGIAALVAYLDSVKS